VWKEHRDALMADLPSGEMPHGFWMFEAEEAGAPKRVRADVRQLGPTPLDGLERERDLERARRAWVLEHVLDD
jgi:hypothetical protein